jgi:hypothetical protein
MDAEALVRFEDLSVYVTNKAEKRVSHCKRGTVSAYKVAAESCAEDHADDVLARGEVRRDIVFIECDDKSGI